LLSIFNLRHYIKGTVDFYTNFVDVELEFTIDLSFIGKVDFIPGYQLPIPDTGRVAMQSVGGKFKLKMELSLLGGAVQADPRYPPLG